MWIDTHCHLGDAAFDPDRDAVVAAMRDAGVSRALVIESALQRLPTTRDWVATSDGFRLATGCHPHDAANWNDRLRDQLMLAWQDPLIAAVGEIGLDYHYDHAPRDVQRAIFGEQLALAAGLGKPVVIHAREADADTVAILREQPSAVIVLHSFSSGPLLRDAGLAAGWYFSFSGMVTFKSWTQHDTVRAVPDDRLLVETDAPYLAPVPHRGRRNQPAYVADVGAGVAAIRSVAVDAIAAVTTANAARLFWA